MNLTTKFLKHRKTKTALYKNTNYYFILSRTIFYVCNMVTVCAQNNVITPNTF